MNPFVPLIYFEIPLIRPPQTPPAPRDGPPLPEPLPVPADLLYAIVENMDSEDVRTCALAARQFLPIARARNFTNVYFGGFKNRCAGFAQLILARPEIADHVRTVALNFAGLPGGSEFLLGNSAPDLSFILSSFSKVRCLQIWDMQWSYVPHDQQKALLGLGKTVKTLTLGTAPHICHFESMAQFFNFVAAFQSLDVIDLQAARLPEFGNVILPQSVAPVLALTKLYGGISLDNSGPLGSDMSVVSRCLSWILPDRLKLVGLDLSDVDEMQCRETVEKRIFPDLHSSLQSLALSLSCSILDGGTCWLAATLQSTTPNLTSLSLLLPADDLLKQINQLFIPNSLAHLRHLHVAASVNAWMLSLQDVIALRGLCLTSKLSTLLIVLTDGADHTQLLTDLEDSPYSDITEQLPRLGARIGPPADRYINLVPYWRLLREHLFDLSERTDPTCDGPCPPTCACDRSGPLLTINQQEANQVALEFVNCCCPHGPVRFAE